MQLLHALALLLVAIAGCAVAQTAIFPANYFSLNLSPGITNSLPSSPGTLFSQTHEPQFQHWQTNSLWWSDVTAPGKKVTVTATGPFEITSIDIQADCGETMVVEWFEPHKGLWLPYGSLGPRSCPGLRTGTLTASVAITTAVRIGCIGSDLQCSVSRFIPFGAMLPPRFTGTFNPSIVQVSGSPMGVSVANFFNPASQADFTAWDSQSVYWNQGASNVKVSFGFGGYCSVHAMSLDLDCQDNYHVELLNRNTGMYDAVASFGGLTCPGLRQRYFTNTASPPAQYTGFRIGCSGGDLSCSVSRVNLYGDCVFTNYCCPEVTAQCAAIASNCVPVTPALTLACTTAPTSGACEIAAAVGAVYSSCLRQHAACTDLQIGC